ncbi:MAG TPA: thioredoxin [Terriglobia bacterium]|jgi:thioredoxin 1|nr:thioredoxin [Terriglobia bacterium]
MGNIKHLNRQQWQATEKDPKPTLVDFWASWCAPCRAMEPTFEKLAEKYSGQFNFAKVNVDDEPELAGKFGIRSIPTLILLKDGKVAEQLIGARPYSELARVLEAHAPVAAK